MKFNHPQDTKAILIGLVTSVVAVAIWDTFKWKKKLLQFKPKGSQEEFARSKMLNAVGRGRVVKPSVGQTTDPISDAHPTTPIGGFDLCCLWGCSDCTWTWGGGQWNPPNNEGYPQEMLNAAGEIRGGNAPNFMSIINEARQKGKYSGSDRAALTQLYGAWARLQTTPPRRDPGQKWKCKGCGGGNGFCVLGGCFNGRGITWPI
tara:strand:- start:2463 stop:3074 length:612 start_codon:yes stop_codon:yes gene_type:complete